MNLTALITLLIYALIIVGVGYWAARKSKSEEAFLLGNRELGPIVAGLAYAASSSSAWVLLGFSGFVYAVGISALWMVPGILIGYAAVWLFAGPVLRKASTQNGNLTLTDFLLEGSGRGTGQAIRVAASLMIAFCFAYYVASQFQGAGIALDGLFDTGLTGGVLIGAIVILAYTFFGGFLAVSIINTLQGMLIAVVAVVLPLLAFLAVGGLDGLLLAAGQQGSAEYHSTFFDISGGRTGWLATGFIVGLFATGFGALGQPHLTAWIMATKDSKSRVIGAGIALVWGLAVYTGMAILGIAARVIIGPDAAAESVFFQLSELLLPSILSGIVIAATLSAIMSTVDSLLLVSGAALGHDLGAFKKLNINSILGYRLGILLVCIAAVGVTVSFPATIFDRTLFAWVALGASFGPTVVVRALGFKPAGLAVLLSIVLGFTFSLLFEFVLDAGPGGVWSRIIPWLFALVPFLLIKELKKHSAKELN